MSTTSRGSGNNYLKGTPTFDFAHIVPEPATPAALSPYHRTISSYSYGYVGCVDTSTSISIASANQLPIVLFRVTVAANRTMHHTVVPPAGAHRQIRACTIERQRYSRTVSSRGCSNYVRTYSVHSDVHDDRRHVQWCIYSGRWNGILNTTH
jgi:hypothetical protein